MWSACRFFLFSEAKEAVEVIEASDVIMSVEVIEATKVFRITQNLMAKSPYFGVLVDFSEILSSLRIETVEDRDVTFNQIKGLWVKFPLLRMPKPPSNQI